MKVAICNVREFNPGIGGIERVSVSLATELSKLGVEVVFIACLKAGCGGEYTLPGRQLFLPDSTDYSSANITELIRILEAEKIDVVVNQNAHSLLFHKTVAGACRKAGRPLISVLHFSPDIRIANNRNVVSFGFMPLAYNLKALAKTICTYWPLKWFTLHYSRRLYRALHNDSDKVLLLSPRYIPVFFKIAGLKRDDKVDYIYNMLSFKPESVDGEKKKQILYCGRFEHSQKRPDRLLRIWGGIFKRLIDWELVIVGDGPESSRLKELAEKLKHERVRFEGFRNPVPYYKSASILAMTSNHEGLPLVLSEAMQYGCVPIAFDSFRSVRDIISDGTNGLLIHPFDLKEYGNVIAALANNQGLLESLAKNAKESVNKFAPANIATKWMKLLEDTISYHILVRKNIR